MAKKWTRRTEVLRRLKRLQMAPAAVLEADAPDQRSAPDQTTADNAHDDVRMVEYSQAMQVVREQMGARPHLPAEQLHYGRLEFADQLLAELADDEVHALAEQAALNLESALDEAEGDDDQPTLYQTRWTRVSDEVFARYGHLEDRRPA